MDDRLLFMLSKVQHRITTHMKKELQRAGLTLSPGQVAILLLLGREKETVMGDLGKGLEMDNAAVSRLADKLETRGLVVRELNPRNRRQMLIRITDAGLEQAATLKRIAMDANNRILSGFTREEIDVYKKVNQAIIDRFTS